MARPLNSQQAATLIERETGRTCTRQNLEKLCDRGGLRGSRCILQAKPLRVDGEIVVAEYLSSVAPFQAEAEQPRAKRDRPAQRPAGHADDLPEYTISRARSEFEKANILELQRKTQEGLLLLREDAEAAWKQAVNITKSRLRGVPSAVKQRIPHLEPEEVDLMVQLIDEALSELAAGEVAK